MAIEADGNVLAADRRSSFGIIRVDVVTGQQTGLDIGATPIDGLAVVPTQSQHYDLVGLFAPYAPPTVKQFQAGSVIPLKWQFTQEGAVIDSAAYAPTLKIDGPVNCDGGSSGPGSSGVPAGKGGFRYAADTGIWQFNWKTTRDMAGCFNIVIGQPTLGVNRSFSIRLVR